MASHRRPASPRRVPRRALPVAAALITVVSVTPALLVDAGAGAAPVVHTVPAAPAPTVAPYRPEQADRCCWASLCVYPAVGPADCTVQSGRDVVTGPGVWR